MKMHITLNQDSGKQHWDVKEHIRELVDSTSLAMEQQVTERDAVNVGKTRTMFSCSNRKMVTECLCCMSMLLVKLIPGTWNGGSK